MAHQTKLELREGWTERIRMALTINSGTILNLTGMTLGLIGKDRYSQPLAFAGTVGSDNLTGGIIYLDPAATDLLASKSPYRLRWSVTDGSGKTAYFPHDEPMQWVIELP